MYQVLASPIVYVCSCFGNCKRLGHEFYPRLAYRISYDNNTLVRKYVIKNPHTHICTYFKSSIQNVTLNLQDLCYVVFCIPSLYFLCLSMTAVSPSCSLSGKTLLTRQPRRALDTLQSLEKNDDRNNSNGNQTDTGAPWTQSWTSLLTHRLI